MHSGEKKRARVAVVGAGIAGLATAYFLGQAGVEVEVFEAEAEPGGLARSFDLEGQRVERFYHFICRGDHELVRLAQDLGLTPSWRKTRTTFFFEGQLYPFTTPGDLLRFSPLPLRDRLALGLSSLRWVSIKDWQSLDELTAKEWLCSQVGSRIYETIFQPLLGMKFGEFAERVSAAWLWHRLFRVASSRQGFWRTQVMGYLPGGSETLVQRLQEEVRKQHGHLHIQSPVSGVLENGKGKVGGLVVAGKEKEYPVVALAVPLPIAARLLPPKMATFRERLENIPFLGLICVVARLAHSPSQSFWCNIHDRRLSLTGLIELSELNPEMKKGGALVYAPHYLPAESPNYLRSETELKAEFENALSVLCPSVAEKGVLSFHVFREPFAQAVCLPGFSQRRPSLTTPLPGLYLIDSTHLYPEDRTISGTIAKARELARLILSHLRP